MGREVRMIPPDWVHPTNDRGEPIPLYRNERFPSEDPEVTITENDVMPDFGDRATHFQMYETCSEGTPISPAFATAEELARWLADNNASAFGSMTATYEQWLSTIRRGFAVGAVWSPGRGIRSGVEAMHDE